ncbi:MAG: cobalamin B12-binding domain-containing protein [Oscillospiraceae bacterium]|nr:cobalamin B12-binding domain-containing protein [Oscillospiraceae bacterium]
MKKGLIIGASVGGCVHVAGAVRFLNIAEDLGYKTLFAGPAVKVDHIIELVREHKPQMVALGYRLTPENVVPIVEELKTKSKTLVKQPIWIFGGTNPVAAEVAKLGFFDKIFDGMSDHDDSIAFLRNAEKDVFEQVHERKFLARMVQKRPYPLLRHHFGLPSFEQTRRGITEIAESKVLDVISLGIDQNTQQFYFNPEDRDPKMDGAGGVPVMNEAQFKELKEASLCGNYPLMRCYSGTADVIPFASILVDSIDNAWCAVPLFWYNELDGRGTRTLEDSMRDAHELISWHAQRSIPVELNEPHHWGLRDAHDVISVAASFLSAYHSKKLGVKHYIAQYMFNVPGSLSFSMDLAKVLAQIEITESLHDGGFTSFRQTRAGLPFLSGDLSVAKGQLAASTMLQMAVNPDIIHVVGYSEAEHAATPGVIIESSKIVRGVVRSCLQGNVDLAADPVVQVRKTELVSEAKYLLDFICSYYRESADPLFDPAVLADCVRRGILDSPHIVKNDTYRGILNTRVIDGKCVAWDAQKGQPINEKQRLEMLMNSGLLKTVVLKEGYCA